MARKSVCNADRRLTQITPWTLSRGQGNVLLLSLLSSEYAHMVSNTSCIWLAYASLIRCTTLMIQCLCFAYATKTVLLIFLRPVGVKDGLVSSYILTLTIIRCYKRAFSFTLFPFFQRRRTPTWRDVRLRKIPVTSGGLIGIRINIKDLTFDLWPIFTQWFRQTIVFISVVVTIWIKRTTRCMLFWRQAVRRLFDLLYSFPDSGIYIGPSFPWRDRMTRSKSTKQERYSCTVSR